MSPRHPVDPAEDRPDAPAGSVATSRRRFVRNVGVGAAALGAVAVTGGVLTSVASAQTESEPPDLGPGDVELVRWLQSLSIAAEEGLSAASDATFLQSSDANMLRGFSRHHRDQAAALGALLPEEEVVEIANARLLAELDDDVTGAGNRAALLGVVQQFEERLAATMLAAVGEAELFVVAGLIASAAPVLGQQAATLASVAGQPIADWLPPFVTTEGAYSQAAYPAP